MTEREWMEGDYPSDAALSRIRNWPIANQASIDALWAFARELWIYPDRFVPSTEHTVDMGWMFGGADWYVSTGGWSGHEDVIAALMDNYLFWSLCWRVHSSGGHYWFQIADRIE